ncbi:hypothetical protein CVT25_014277 [Psilocybe cyanescens]|uniref:Uncharacterized protein n=1 Tax=Psilocybe cyanescens TaxID=93625 RepID=A0A409WUA9_PSICY|nr:hypothetical protein CVT25_014277 [Psilocybe cyanescens]
MHDIATLHAPYNGDCPLIPWTDLKFNPVGVYHLCLHQGVFPHRPNFYKTNRLKFDAADVAWFAAGMHKDGNHDHSPQTFHPLAEALQKDTKEMPKSRSECKELLHRVQELTFDLATLWDCALGGTTMILHCTGTTVPGAPIQLEYLKAQVYLPLAFVSHKPQLHKPIMKLVQLFIETIGLKTSVDWPDHAQALFGYSLTQTGIVRANRPMTSFPNPERNSSYYMFLGQPITPSVATTTSPPISTSYDDGNVLSAEAYEIFDLHNVIHTLQEEKSSLAKDLEILRSQVSILENQLQSYSTGPGSTAHIRYTTTIKPAISAEQRKEKAKEREQTQEEIDNAVNEWFKNTIAKANELADRFNKKPRHFLDIFFHGGARMINTQEKVNPHNAFLKGHVVSMVNIKCDYMDEYNALKEEEHEELACKHKENKDSSRKLWRPLPRGRICDVSNVKWNMIFLLNGLKAHIGIEAFFCIVRNTPDYHIQPQWYFTSETLADYMKIAVRKRWDAHEVGTKIEAFSIAGCNPVNLLSTSKQKADYLKSQIRHKFESNLEEITGNPHTVMHYLCFEEDIVLRYGIDLVGYTYKKLMNPSDLSTSLPLLKALLDALENGTCKFVKLSAQELKKRQDAYNTKLISGEIEPHKRKRRSDAGVKQKGKHAHVNNAADRDEEEGESNIDVIEHPKNSEFIDNATDNAIVLSAHPSFTCL